MERTSFFHHQNNVVRTFDLMLMEAKKFTDVAFYSIPMGCWANFFLYYNSQSVKCLLIPKDKEDEVP
jgi:hypothetical protein